jgi:membrane protein DedA with SNARE-associated domain
MSSLFAVLLSWLLLYKYTLLFGVFFFSALALPLPGNTLLLATGAFASQGYMNFWIALLSVLLGNIAGDIAGFVLADIYGEKVIEKMRIKRSYLAGMERYVTRHPRITIVLSRFGGTLDPVVNILCGLGDVSLKTFVIFDIMGNAISLFVVITVGYYLGNYWQSFSGVISTIGWIIFALLAALGLAVIFRRQIGVSEWRLVRSLRSGMRRLLNNKLNNK